MKVLIACEFSGVVRDAFRALGHDAWSCDLLESESDQSYHIQGDVLNELQPGRWDLMIAHPPCTRLANSGVRWLHERNLWDDLDAACEFYLKFREAPVPLKAIENPVMHKHAIARIGSIKRHIVQPWWFGDKAFKATGFELHGLSPLKPTNRLTTPLPGTEEHKKWSSVHREPPGPNRWKNRSRTFPGIALAMAQQWGTTKHNNRSHRTRNNPRR